MEILNLEKTDYKNRVAIASWKRGQDIDGTPLQGEELKLYESYKADRDKAKAELKGWLVEKLGSETALISNGEVRELVETLKAVKKATGRDLHPEYEDMTTEILNDFTLARINKFRAEELSPNTSLMAKNAIASMKRTGFDDTTIKDEVTKKFNLTETQFNALVKNIR